MESIKAGQRAVQPDPVGINKLQHAAVFHQDGLKQQQRLLTKGMSQIF